MYSVFNHRGGLPLALGALLMVWAVVAVSAITAAPLRVCADPNNMPFSNQHGDGFENKIATLVAREMNRPLAYFWLPQRRGFVRNSLNAQRCDVVIGVPAQYGLLQPTRTYYRSSYAFVSRRDRHLTIDSFDAPTLKTLTIGIQVSGDDYNNPPAAQELASRQIIQNVRGFTIYGDYSRPDPQREIVDAVADGRVDVAIVWGPLAGYYAQRESAPIDVRPIASKPNGSPSTFTFDIAMGVRRDDLTLRTALDAVIERRGHAMRQILRSYGVPLL
jgi:quinoprotein dehydrogenase-associated probable ABC transporter substrate-binding protein